MNSPTAPPTAEAPRRPISWTRRVAGRLAESFLMASGRSLFEANTRNWAMPLNRFQKLAAGVYVILKDYSTGRFPPTFDDQARAYQAEIDCYDAMAAAGIDKEENARHQMRKPFWGANAYDMFAPRFGRLLRILEQLPLNPPGQLLELGCGTGWMAEFLALSGYNVVGTSIAPAEIEIANRRARSFEAKGVQSTLQFAVAPMESVDEHQDFRGRFDGVYVFEALHHAFNWRQAAVAARNCLKPGGWFILASEPNVLHTFISYRVARLANSHEIGFSKRELLDGLRAAGFQSTRVFAPRLNNGVSQFWIAAQR